MNLKIFYLFTIAVYLGSSLSLTAQVSRRYNCFSYNVNEGLLQSNVIDIGFDKNNLCWLSYANGIQKFDGKNFTPVAVQAGLPEDKWVKFFRCTNGDLLISHAQGISKYDVSSNRFVHVYRAAGTVKKNMIFIGEDEGVVYCYNEMGYIAELAVNSYKLLKLTNAGLPAYSPAIVVLPKISDNIAGHRTAILVNGIIYFWDLRLRKVVGQLPAKANILPYFLYLKSADEVYFYTSNVNADLQLFNFTDTSFRILPLIHTPSVKSFRSAMVAWQQTPMLSYYNNLYETDSALRPVAALVNFQGSPIAGNAVIVKMKEDNFGNLYLVTINDGIRKIIRNNYPIKYYGTNIREDNYVISVLPDKKNNRILVGTYGNGLLVFDTLQRLVKNIKTLPGQKKSFSVAQIIQTNNGDYLLFLFSQAIIYKLRRDLSSFTAIPLTTTLASNYAGVGYFTTTVFRNDSIATVQSQGRLYNAYLRSNAVTEYEFTNTSTMSGLLYKGMIVSHSNDELIFLDGTSFKEIKRMPLNHTGDVRCFAKDDANNLYVGSNKGIFKLDSTGKILLHLNKQTGLPDECIYAMAVDKRGYLWCSSNKGIFRIGDNNSILQLKKDDGLQENEFNTNVVAASQDGELFFGGVNGVTSFYPASINSVKEQINLLLTHINVNNEPSFTDTALNNMAAITLPYNQNNLSFDFIAMGKNNPAQYIHQYKMEGIDKHWVANPDLLPVRYLLPPGKYVFNMHASRFFNKDAVAMKQIIIIITPPYWKTWQFITAMALLLIAVMIYTINNYNKRKYQKKLLMLEGENKLQLERERISRDLHDSIGAYANAVLYKTELLQKEPADDKKNELMKDLRFASKDIITSLRETIWALKKDEYAAQDCLLRIRNFIQPFNRYYSHIRFTVNGDAPPQLKLHYTHALNLVRIVQEAVSNAIKHANAKNITVNSSVEDNSWKIAIADDGNGFDYPNTEAMQQGNGLSNIKQRTMDAGFKLSILSHPKNGTIITIFV